MSEVVDLLVDVRSKLYAASRDVLVNAVQELESDVDVTGKDRKFLISRLEKLIASTEGEKDGGRVKLAELKSLFVEPSTAKEEPETPKVSSTADTLSKEIGKLIGFRKDFKLSGTIGGNAGISYLSFIRQVEAGRRKGHPEAEIVDGIVRAVQPNARLQSYLEGRDDLTLPVLQAVIRSYYQEKTATEHYQELCTISQGNKESPQDFLFRALSLKQKILFASKEDPTLGYDPKLVEGQFKHACLTGMANDMIRLEFRELLGHSVSDEKLIEGLNAITRRQAEVERKAQGSKSISVKAVTTATDVNKEVLDEIRALREEVKDLKLKCKGASSDTDTSSGKESNRAAKRSRGNCQECRKLNDPNNRCTHCFICGGSHLKWNCPERKSSQGNEQGPSQ